MSNKEELANLRKSIDTLDSAIVLILSERFKVTKRVAEFKRMNNISAVDKEREKSQASSIRKIAKTHGLNPELVERILRCVIDEVVKDHKKSGVNE